MVTHGSPCVKAQEINEEDEVASERLSREERREAILDAAGEVFTTKGFDATRMEDVARVAGIAKGLLYKHFASKDALFDALVDRQGNRYVAEIRAILGAADVSASPEEATRRGLALWLRQFSSDRATFQLTDPGSHRAYDRLRDQMRGVIADGIRAVDPTIDPGDEWLAAAAVQGAAEAVALAWRSRRGQITEVQANDVLSVFCWGGLIALQRAVSVTRAENAPT
jgi:AcrR family transcriptional regulator